MERNSYDKESKRLELHYTRTNGEADEEVDRLIKMVGGIQRPELVRSIIIAALKAGQEDNETADLKLMATSMKEMRYTVKAFNPYRHVKKVSIFGSARTQPDEAAYGMARMLGKKLAESGYMIITGGGAGIMQAAHEGAGPEFSFGVNIQLPFEQKANPVIDGNPKNISYKYFFNRKVAFIKESDAIALFPGGFGTFDEAMETLTLVQTGKRNPVPVILLDEPEGVYWIRWIEFIKKNLLMPGYISKADLTLFDRTESVDDAVEIINRFYLRYHSLRYIGNRLVIRLTSGIDQERLEELRDSFSDILRPHGDMFLSKPLPEERDEPELDHLPRLILDFTREKFGRLRELIDAINES